MELTELWPWLVVGFLPYQVSWYRGTGAARALGIRALFWSFSLRQPGRGGYRWSLHVGLLERLRRAAWAAISHLQVGK